MHFIEAQSCNCIDTLGAGDCFAGTFIHGLAKGMRWSEAAHLANIAAAKVVSRVGPRIKQREAKEIQQQFSAVIEA